MPLPTTDDAVEYIDSLDYDNWQTKIADLISAADELHHKAEVHRRLRYSGVDTEDLKRVNKLAPDELYIPQHIIDMNVRREQSSYVQYITQSPRAVILSSRIDPTVTGDLLERDVTNRLRYDNWQIPLYANIDSFQQNGYSIVELVYDANKPGNLKHETIPLGDLGFVNDTKDIQDCEIVSRKYYFTKTKLKGVAKTYGFDLEQVKDILNAAVQNVKTEQVSVTDKRDRSLVTILKVMFRHKGVVQVAWCQSDKGTDWLRKPQSLFIGRCKLQSDGVSPILDAEGKPEKEYETEYPYVLFPYLISENNTISELKGRCFLDQDVQEAVTSLMSSFCTAHRRGAGLYFSKDVDDPNTTDEILQKNVYFRTGALINSKIKQFQLTAPPAEMLSAVQALVTANMQETSQVNFAAQNRKDSRKTATEIQASTQSQQALSTVQVVLFSTALRQMYQKMFDIIRTRVLSGMIQVSDILKQLYAGRWIVKPSGDVDVIERQQLIQQMQNSWPVMQNTPANIAFLSDLLTKLFPESAQKYIQIFQQSQAQQAQQAQSQQAQMMQQAMQMAQGVVKLSKHPEWFSDAGKAQALPTVVNAAEGIEQMMKQQQSQQAQQGQGQK
jgi:hypothetical protein